MHGPGLSAPSPCLGKDTMVCLSEGDFCLSLSSFSSCLSSSFWTCLNFLISAYGRRRVLSCGPSPPRGPRRSAVLTWVCFICTP